MRAEYEDTFNRITLLRDALDNSTRYDYDSLGSMTTMTRANDASRSFGYDGKGLLTLAVDATGNSTSYEYDSNGLRTNMAILGMTTTYTVDALGRRLTTESPELRLTIREFDNGGRVTKQTTPEGIATAYEYDHNGWLTGRVLNDGGTPTFRQDYQRDVDGQVTKTIDPQLSLTTTYTYDLDRRLTKIARPGDRVSKFTFDELDRQLTSTFGDSSDQLTRQILTYDKSSNIVTSQDAEGNETAYQYDGFSRRTKAILPTGDNSTSDYDDLYRVTTAKQFASGGGSPLTRSDTVFDSLGRTITSVHKADAAGSGIADDDEA